MASHRWQGNGLIRRPIRLLGFASRGTASKILLVFFVALLPLGVIALLGVVQALRTSDSERNALIELSTEQRAGRLTRKLLEDRRLVNRLLDVIHDAPAQGCAQLRAALAPGTSGARDFAVYSRRGALICASDNIPPPLPAARRFDDQRTSLHPALNRLVNRGVSRDGQMVALIYYTPATLIAIGGRAPADHLRRLSIGDEQVRLDLIPARVSDDGSRLFTATAPIDFGLRLTETVETRPLTFGRFLTLCLPLIFWLLAAALAWYFVHLLLVAPLIRLQRALARYRPGDEPDFVDARSHVLEEINVLGETFRAMAQDVASHEQQILENLEQQRRLTREVHHRVKNNLQIITSLVSLHSRAAKGEDAIAAYATIQRRVDALAVVHRNHFAEMEQNDGISCSALLSELAASLRGGGSDIGSAFALRVDCDPMMVDQDTAVPIAFLVTELVELAIRVDPDATVHLSLRREEGQGPKPRATLAIESPALCPSEALELLLEEGFGRVLIGLSRQLRTSLEYHESEGRYAISVPVL